MLFIPNISYFIVVAIQAGSFIRMLTFSPDSNFSCIDFVVDDDSIALEDPDEYVWTFLSVEVPRAQLSGSTTRVLINDNDSKSQAT